MKTKNLIVLALFSLTFWSCDSYLDKQPTGDLTLEQVFAEEAFARQFHSNICRMVPTESNFADPGWEWRSPYTGGCDEMEIAYGGAYTHLINDGSWGPTNIGNIPVWRESYITIRKCNIFLKRIVATPMDETEKNRWIAEIHFQRAFNYFWIFRAYGPFVILEDEIASDADFMDFTRSTVKECIDFIVADCDKAAAGCDKTTNAATQGRVTSIAALALKARALLYQASPLWNGNTAYANFKSPDGTQLVPQTYDASLWQRAADAALDCITKGRDNGYDLYRSSNNDPYWNYTNIWQEFYNKEWIFFKHNGGWQHLNMCSDPVSYGSYSIMNPTQELVDSYQMADGSTPITGYTNNGLTPIINAASGYKEDAFTTEAHPNGYHPAGVWNMYANREPRFYASINFAKQMWKHATRPLEFWYAGVDGRRNAGTDYCKTGYLMKKIVDHSFRVASMGNVSRPHAWVFMRLGEQYLNYAEALNEAQGPVADVYTYVNQIRDRAGLPGLPSGLSKDDMRERIRHERQIELAFETHRFFDSRRWKIAEITENKPIHSLNIMAGDNADDPAFYGRITVEPRIFTAPKHYLFPFTTAEFDKIRTIAVQNPGWPGSIDEQD
jgi:hypothetical protein